jgi:hypothetical protein
MVRFATTTMERSSETRNTAMEVRASTRYACFVDVAGVGDDIATSPTLIGD